MRSSELCNLSASCIPLSTPSWWIRLGEEKKRERERVFHLWSRRYQRHNPAPTMGPSSHPLLKAFLGILGLLSQLLTFPSLMMPNRHKWNTPPCRIRQLSRIINHYLGSFSKRLHHFFLGFLSSCQLRQNATSTHHFWDQMHLQHGDSCTNTWRSQPAPPNCCLSNVGDGRGDMLLGLTQLP